MPPKIESENTLIRINFIVRGKTSYGFKGSWMVVRQALEQRANGVGFPAIPGRSWVECSGAGADRHYEPLLSRRRSRAEVPACRPGESRRKCTHCQDCAAPHSAL